MKNILKFFTFAILLIASVAYLVSCGGGGGDSNEAPKAMAAPGSVKAILGNTKTAVTWNAALNATSYNIYWSATSGVSTTSGTKITDITDTYYTHSEIDNGTKYYYIVTSVGSTGESVASDEVSATPNETTGAVSAVAANLLYNKTMGQAGTNAKLNTVTVSPDTGITDLEFNAGGTWTHTGANGEATTITFWDASDSSNDTLISQDISDWANYSPGGSLNHLLKDSALDKSKVKIKMEIKVQKTFSSGMLSEIDTTLTTICTGCTAADKIPLDDESTASYTFSGIGSAKLSDANTTSVTLTDMEITASNMGVTINGSSTTNIPIDNETYTITGSFDEKGSIQNTVKDETGSSVGTVGRSSVGSFIIFTDSSGNETLL